MLEIKTFPCNMLGENCYIVSDETRECVIIDCGALFEPEYTQISKYIEDKELKPVHQIYTHGHLDHVFGSNFVYRQYNLKAEIHGEDVALLQDVKNQATQFLGFNFEDDAAPVGSLLKHSETVSFGNHSFEIIATPGHTKGCVCFYCSEEKTAFTGDTLFNMSVGRTDLIGGSFAQLQASLQTLRETFTDDTKIYCGHGPETVWETELKYNPYLK